jgi:ubiquitin C-terminal hydrolase
MHSDKNVLGKVHCPGGNGKWHHRYAETVNINFGDVGWMMCQCFRSYTAKLIQIKYFRDKVIKRTERFCLIEISVLSLSKFDTIQHKPAHHSKHHDVSAKFYIRHSKVPIPYHIFLKYIAAGNLAELAYNS